MAPAASGATCLRTGYGTRRRIGPYRALPQSKTKPLESAINWATWLHGGRGPRYAGLTRCPRNRQKGKASSQWTSAAGKGLPLGLSEGLDLYQHKRPGVEPGGSEQRDPLVAAGLAASGWFPYGAHIGYIKINEVTESVQSGHGRSVGRKPLIDQSLGLARPFLGVVTAQERLARVAALASDLDPVSSRGTFGDGCHFPVRYVCNEWSQSGAFGDIRA
jgi:hypothetical protein